jgi:hypothetical protein
VDAIQPTVVTIGFAAVFALAAVGVFVPAAVRPALVVATLAALVIWVTGRGLRWPALRLCDRTPARCSS